jgi:hypothetical protein
MGGVCAVEMYKKMPFCAEKAVYSMGCRNKTMEHVPESPKSGRCGRNKAGNLGMKPKFSFNIKSYVLFPLPLHDFSAVSHSSETLWFGIFF